MLFSVSSHRPCTLHQLISGVTERWKADPSPKKINLGVGKSHALPCSEAISVHSATDNQVPTCVMSVLNG
jgi:hypothetical protein